MFRDVRGTTYFDDGLVADVYARDIRCLNAACSGGASDYSAFQRRWQLDVRMGDGRHAKLGLTICWRAWHGNNAIGRVLRIDRRGREARLRAIIRIFGGMIPAAAVGSVAVYTPTPSQIGTMNGLMVMGTNAGMLFGPRPWLLFELEPVAGAKSSGLSLPWRV